LAFPINADCCHSAAQPDRARPKASSAPQRTGFSLPCPAGAQSGRRVRGRSRTRRSPGASTDTRPSTAAIARPGQARRIFFFLQNAGHYASTRSGSASVRAVPVIQRSRAAQRRLATFAHRTAERRGASPRRAIPFRSRAARHVRPTRLADPQLGGGRAGPARDAAERAPRGNERESKSRELATTLRVGVWARRSASRARGRGRAAAAGHARGSPCVPAVEQRKISLRPRSGLAPAVFGDDSSCAVPLCFGLLWWAFLQASHLRRNELCVTLGLDAARIRASRGLQQRESTATPYSARRY